MASSPPSSLLTSPTLSSTPAFPSLSSASLPPSDITLAGILTELSLCHHRNQQVAHQLQQLTQQHRQTTELILPTLSSLSSTLPPVTQSAAALNSILSNSALSASALSSQVRILDLTQSRLLAALQRTAALLDLKNTIATVEKEREKGAWDVCVRELHRVLYCARTIQDRQYERLRELEEELRAELEALMRRREEDGQWKEVVTYARLLPYLDRTFVGLSAACLAVRQLLHSALTSKAITLSSQPPQSVLPFTSLLTGILDQVALCLKQWMQQLRLSFGAGTQLRLLQEVTAECDQEVAPILRQFMQDRRVAALVREVKQAQLTLGLLKKAAGGGAAAAAGSGRGGSEGEVDARTLDALLTEMAFLSREVDQFDANMRSLAKQAEESLQRGIEQEERQMQLMQQPQTDDEITAANSLPSPSSSSSSASVSPASSPPKLSLYYHLSAVQAAMAQSAYGASLRATSAVREACQELLGHYIGLEEHYMLLNVDKAMRIDVHEGGGDEQQEEDEEEEREDEERRRSRESREREGVSSRVQAISDKLTHNIASNISNINLAIQATSGIGILMSGAAAGGAAAGQAASSSSSSLPSVSPTFLRRFRTTLTSTLVDDTFFILKKCTERAFSTASAQAACALVNHINSLLQREYYEQLESVLVEYERKYTPQQKAAGVRLGCGGGEQGQQHRQPADQRGSDGAGGQRAAEEAERRRAAAAQRQQPAAQHGAHQHAQAAPAGGVPGDEERGGGRRGDGGGGRADGGDAARLPRRANGDAAALRLSAQQGRAAAAQHPHRPPQAALHRLPLRLVRAERA